KGGAVLLPSSILSPGRRGGKIRVPRAPSGLRRSEKSQLIFLTSRRAPARHKWGTVWHCQTVSHAVSHRAEALPQRGVPNPLFDVHLDRLTKAGKFPAKIKISHR